MIFSWMGDFQASGGVFFWNGGNGGGAYPITTGAGGFWIIRTRRRR